MDCEFDLSRMEISLLYSVTQAMFGFMDSSTLNYTWPFVSSIVDGSIVKYAMFESFYGS